MKSDPDAQRSAHLAKVEDNEAKANLLGAQEEYLTRGMTRELRRLWRISAYIRARLIPLAPDMKFLCIALEQIADGEDPREALEIEKTEGRKKGSEVDPYDCQEIAERLRKLMETQSKEKAIEVLSIELERERVRNPSAKLAGAESWVAHIDWCYRKFLKLIRSPEYMGSHSKNRGRGKKKVKGK